MIEDKRNIIQNEMEDQKNSLLPLLFNAYKSGIIVKKYCFVGNLLLINSKK